MRIAIQGEAGSFHHEAAQKWFGTAVEIVPAETFGDVFATVRRGDAEMAIVAIENSLYGSIDEVPGLIEAYRYPIVGEIYLRIKQQLIALPGASLNQITRVYSHPVALAQCAQYLDEHLPHAERIEYHDTSASVAHIQELNDPTAAAIAGRSAAKLHGLPILAENIEDNKENFTRFLVLNPRGNPGAKTTKASLVLVTSHQPGALAKALSAFAETGANLTKIESRPIIGTPWKYKFYIDIEATAEQFKQASNRIRKDGSAITVLGLYESANL